MSTRKPRGRPPSARNIDSAAVNYQALAWEAKVHMDEARANGRFVAQTTAVRTVMIRSVRRRKALGLPAEYDLVKEKFKTAYTEVRKILKRWGNAKAMVSEH